MFQVPEDKGEEDYSKKQFGLYKDAERRRLDVILAYQNLKQEGMLDDICMMHLGRKTARVPKKPLREVHKEMSKAVAWTADDVEHLRHNHKRQLDNLKEAGNYVRLKSMEAVKAKSREFIFLTTQHVVSKLQEEVKGFLAQFKDFSDQMSKKDQQLNQLCDQIRE